MSYRSTETGTTSRRVIDQAIGVLVGLRGCSPAQAFAEIVDVMDQTGLGIGTVSQELVALAGDVESSTRVSNIDVWADLISLHRTLVTWPARHLASLRRNAPAVGHATTSIASGRSTMSVRE